MNQPRAKSYKEYISKIRSAGKNFAVKTSRVVRSGVLRNSHRETV